MHYIDFGYFNQYEFKLYLLYKDTQIKYNVYRSQLHVVLEAL